MFFSVQSWWLQKRGERRRREEEKRMGKIFNDVEKFHRLTLLNVYLSLATPSYDESKKRVMINQKWNICSFFLYKVQTISHENKDKPPRWRYCWTCCTPEIWSIDEHERKKTFFFFFFFYHCVMMLMKKGYLRSSFPLVLHSIIQLTFCFFLFQSNYIEKFYSSIFIWINKMGKWKI